METVLLALCKENSTMDYSHKGSVVGSFDVLFIILNKLLNTQSICWWFEIHERSYTTVITYNIFVDRLKQPDDVFFRR